MSRDYKVIVESAPSVELIMAAIREFRADRERKGEKRNG